MNPIKYILITIASLLLFTTKAQTYYITNTSMGLSGSADVVLASAVSAANAGGNVVVNMNASGLCVLTGQIILNQSAGTITIQKDPSATVDQGFMYSSILPYLSGFTEGFFCALSATVNLSFKNIKFYQISHAVTISGGNNVSIDNCNFASCGRGVYFSGLFTYYTWQTATPTHSVVIQNCAFDNINMPPYSDDGCILRDNIFTNNFSQNYFKIKNNDFKTALFGVRIFSAAQYDMLDIEILNNYSSGQGIEFGVGANIIYSGNVLANETSNYLFNLRFENNTAVKQLALSCPLDNWKIEGNTFKGNGNGNYLNINHQQQTRSFKCGFINTSTPYCLNQSFLNGNNIFLKPPGYPNITNAPYAFNVAGNKSTGCNITEILDLDIPGTARISDNVVVRRCKIFSSSFPNLPIARNPEFTGILFPTYINSGNLIVYYSYGGISNSDNNDLYIDFYKSNNNGDLLDYIGTQFVPSGSLIGYGSSTLSIPSSITLLSGDRVAMTLTGMHPQGASNIRAKGTSQAFYPIAPCTAPTFVTPDPTCIGPMSFTANSSCVHPQTVLWNFGDGSYGVGGYATHNYNAPGIYSVTLMVSAPWQASTYSVINTVTVNFCAPPQTCSNCIGSFAPDPGEYILSAWVKEDAATIQKTFSNPKVQVSFTGHPNVFTFGTSSSKNKIIDGWQRIEEAFTIPINATHVNINLVNLAASGGNDCYFDDIRIMPKDAQMKSYVYDPVTLRLSAVLDENNYATFYEYDEEGKLLRTKKETERGIMTVQENREGLKKK